MAPPSDGADAHPDHEPIATVALKQGLRCKKRLLREKGRQQLEAFPLAPWASRRRDLLELLDRLTPTITELTQQIEHEVEKYPAAQRLMNHPGAGALTALAFVLIIGEVERFECGKQIPAYLGLVPVEDSSGERRRLGHISKQGSGLMRFLLVEAAQVTVRSDAEWRSKFFHLAMRRGRKIAKVAMARRLAVGLYWMWRQQWDYEQLKKFGPTFVSLDSSRVISPPLVVVDSLIAFFNGGNENDCAEARRAGKNHNRRAAHHRYGAALHPPEVAAIWNVSVDTVIRRFGSQPGVIEIGNDETVHKRRKKLIRLPGSVLEHESHRSKKST